MKPLICVAVLLGAGVPLFAQETAQPAPGMLELLARLNTPLMVKPAVAAPLGKNWFKLETDAHILTDQVTVQQAGSVFLDLEHSDSIYNGKKSTLKANVVSRNGNEVIVDFLTVSIAPLGIKIKTPYQAVVTATVSTADKFVIEVRQTDGDSNTDIKNLFATRYAEAFVIDGKPYTYIRIYTIDDVNASILPGAKRVLENSAEPINTEVLQLIVDAAKTR